MTIKHDDAGQPIERTVTGARSRQPPSVTSKRGKPRKSMYVAKNPQKYVGDVKDIVCRSSWEVRLCHWMDVNDSVLQWSSETIIIPYTSAHDGRRHRYYPDFWCRIAQRDGSPPKMFILEVKPHAETLPPKRGGNKTEKSFQYQLATYLRNKSKWEAAHAYCQSRNMSFWLVDEYALGIKRTNKVKR